MPRSFAALRMTTSVTSFFPLQVAVRNVQANEDAVIQAVDVITRGVWGIPPNEAPRDSLFFWYALTLGTCHNLRIIGVYPPKPPGQDVEDHEIDRPAPLVGQIAPKTCCDSWESSSRPSSCGPRDITMDTRAASRWRGYGARLRARADSRVRLQQMASAEVGKNDEHL